MKNSISIIVPCYNEEGNIVLLHRELKNALAKIKLDWHEIIFVDDGSTDATLARCEEVQAEDASVKIVRLVKNAGHEVAMVAGMDFATGDALVYLDADLQNPPACIVDMVRQWRSGKDIVLMRRSDNPSASKIYRFCARIFYGILNFLSDVKIPAETPDFRLIDRKYADFLKQFDERDFMFRGMLSLVSSLEDSNVSVLYYHHPARHSGETKYNIAKSIKLAINSIIQFSTRPLILALWLAILAGMAAVGLALWVVVEKIMAVRSFPAGYATIVAAVVFMGALNLFILAIIGAYIGKIHIEIKKRPLYFADFIKRDGNGVGQPSDRSSLRARRRKMVGDS